MAPTALLALYAVVAAAAYEATVIVMQHSVPLQVALLAAAQATVP